MARHRSDWFCGLWLALTLALAASSDVASAQDAPRAPRSREEITLSFSPVVKRAAPGVVNVYASRSLTRRSTLLDGDDLFHRFLQERGFGAPRERIDKALGSGVIVSSSGTVITNNHVIEGADEVKVVLSDRSEYDAEILLRDERSDIAILRLRGGRKDFPTVEFGDSDALEVGDLVLAIGNPFGIGQTVTSGIVSAVERTTFGQYYIQTDAAINTGNSGGALVDMSGRLVGINTALFNGQEGQTGSVGIGLAVPSNLARLMAETGSAGGVWRRTWIGAKVETLTSGLVKSAGLERPGGVIVRGVRRRGPAEKAGLKLNDVILAIDDQEIADVKAFEYRLAVKKIGSSSTLKAFRQGREITLSFPIETAPETPPRDPRRIGGEWYFSGLSVVNASPAVEEELAIEAETGVVVVDVAAGSYAGRLGLRKGDVVLAVNGLDIGSTRELERMANVGGRLRGFSLQRAGKRLDFGP